MTNSEISKIIEMLALKLGITTDRMVKVYTPWACITGLSYTLLGVAVLTVGMWLFFLQQPACAVSILGLLGSILIGGMFICENISDMFVPKAAAITKILGLIADLTESE